MHFVARKVGAKKTSRCIRNCDRNCLQPGAVPKDEQFRPAGLQTIVKGLLDQMLQVLPRYAYLVKLGGSFLLPILTTNDHDIQDHSNYVFVSFYTATGGLAPTYSKQ